MNNVDCSQAVILARRPGNTLTRDCLKVVEQAVPECPPGQVLIRTEYLSCDPYLRLRMEDTFEIGQPVPARAMGRVLHSSDARWSVGDQVWGPLAWAEHVVADPAELHRASPSLERPSHALSVCGVPGLTAYVGMMEKGRPRIGENVIVSGAAGAVGSIAGQLAANAGARVVGIVSTGDKARHLKEDLGFHDAIVRTKPDTLREQLGTAFPAGIDLCFENVGGPGLEAALSLLRPGGRIVLCGMAAGYDGGPHPVNGLMALCGPEASIHGLNVSHHLDRLENFSSYMSDLVRRGEVRFHEDIVRGIDNLPAAFLDMLGGGSLGKRLVDVTD